MNKLLANTFMLHLIWHSLILPGLTTLTTGLVLLAFMRGRQNRSAGLLWSLPLLSGLLTGYFSVYHDWSLWPHTVLAWLPALTIATLLVAGWAARRQKLGWLAIAVLVVIASGAMFYPILHQTPPFTTLGELSGAMVLWWVLWVGLASGHDQRGIAGVQIVLAAGLAATGPLSQSIILGQLAMVLGACLVVVVAISWFRADIPLSAPTTDLGTLVLGFLYVELWYYDAAPLRVVLALVVAAAMGMATHRLYPRLPISHRIPSQIISPIATALPTAIGVYFAWQAYSANGSGY